MKLNKKQKDILSGIIFAFKEDVKNDKITSECNVEYNVNNLTLSIKLNINDIK